MEARPLMTGRLTVFQGAAILLLCRLTAFFCCETPFTSAYAAGMAAAVLVQTVLVLPLLRNHAEVPAPVLLLSRIYALLAGAMLLRELSGLLSALHMPHPLPTAAFLLAAMLYTLRLPVTATARTAVLLLLLAGFGFLLLPVSGIGTAQQMHLWMPDSFAGAFLHELRQSREFALLPLILTRVPQNAQSRLRTVLIRAAGQGIILPLTVLLGTVQNGRLTHWQGSPFFLLLARIPLSDALRTDGFWMLLAVGCGLLAVTWFTQTALPECREQTIRAIGAVSALAALAAVMHLTGYDGRGMGLAALLLTAAASVSALTQIRPAAAQTAS